MSKKFVFVNSAVDYEESAGAFEEADFINTSSGGADGGKPIVLDGNGHIDASMINDADIDHGNLSGRDDDDHTLYSLSSGTRDYTGIIAYDDLKTFTEMRQIPHCGYVNDQIAAAITGSASWKEVCLHDNQFKDGDQNSDGILPASNIYFTNQPIVGDFITVSDDGDTTSRTYTFVANQGAESAETDVSIETDAATAMQRLVSRMNVDTGRLTEAVYETTALAEINNGNGSISIFLKDGENIPTTGECGVYGTWATQADCQVLDFENGKYEHSTGTTLPVSYANNFGFGRRAPDCVANEAHSIRSNDKLAVWDNDLDRWVKIATPGAYTASLGVEIVAGDIRADLLSNGGIKVVGNELAVEPGDFVGDGVVDDGSDNIAIDWATVFTIDGADDKAFKVSDIASTLSNKGAHFVGYEDINSLTTADNVNDALDELFSKIADFGNLYTVGAGGVSKGDMVYISGNDTVLPMPITSPHVGIGIAASAQAAGQQVKVLANDTIITGILSGAVAGTKYFWTGGGWSTTPPSGSGEYVWLGGIAKNATDIQVEVDFITKRA